jgi:16S rRNA (adenine(1408)-N(1))-methyltransferase
VLGHDAAVLGGVARLLAPGATATVLLSVIPRDGMPPVPAASALAAAYAPHGLALDEHRPATAADIAAVRSSWGKRLGPRPVTLLRAQRATDAMASTARA